MRQQIGLGLLLLFVAPGEVQATGNQAPPCRSGMWVGTGSMNTARGQHAAALLPSGKVLVTGGADDSGVVVFATAELYDPATGTWSSTASMNIPRRAHTMTLLPTGKVLAAGGQNTEGRDTRPAELYDPDTGQWTATGAMLDERASATATLLPTGKVLVAGGYRGNPPSDGEVFASAELYDPETGEWHATGALSTARFLHAATLLASGEVLVAGGFPPNTSDSAELYDPAAGSWTPTAPMLLERLYHTATRLPSGAVLVAGGSGAEFPIDVPRESEIYDPAARSWRRTDSLPARHTGHTATRLPSGRVLVVGGFGSIPNTELFDPESETWSDAGCALEPRVLHTATILLSGAVLVAGGIDSSGEHTTSSAELYGIVVSPAQVSLAPGASQSFTATRGSGLGYVWSFRQNESGGTVTASGDYQAGPVGGVTDVVQVVDSFDNSATATVSVMRQPTALSAMGSRARSMSCGTTGGAALPPLGGAILILLGWGSFRRPRRARETPAPTETAAASSGSRRGTSGTRR